MQHTTNYNLNKFDATDLLEDTSRLGLNSNFDTIDAALKEASENGGIAVQDTQPTTAVLAWVDSDALGADFCFVGDTEPTNDGSVAVWVDTSEDEIPIQAGAEGVSYDNTDSGLTATDVQGAIDEIAGRDNYSTTETVVGTWVDGKPIYRKCFTVTSPSALNTSTNVVDITDLHIDNMISDYFSIVSVGHNISSSTNNSNAVMFVRLNFNSTGDWLTMSVTNSGYLSSPTIIVIEYTKTTD